VLPRIDPPTAFTAKEVEKTITNVVLGYLTGNTEQVKYFSAYE